ncbi:rhodanese-like domain-containing protein [Roseospira goensis]|uniref:Rhodanese-related sulfurtransferase n=1 Tax=Roseospira goensis TaxID=391922 RepID=A0A7W6S0M1_9PROT|nr:rhodanese-related sulfurtransferase [Roseospira goensis]
MDGTDLFSMDILLPVLIGMGAVLLFRLMPRLLASGVPFVSPKEVRARLDSGDDMLVLDVRSPREFAGRGGHVPGALNLPLDQLGQRLKALGPDLGDTLETPVFVVCQTSSRAAHAARILKKAGFRNLSVMGGGMSAWRAQGHPTRQDTADA